MIAADPLSEGAPPPVTGGSWVDGPTLLLPPTATVLPLCGVDDSTAAGNGSDEDASILGKTYVASAFDEAVIEELKENRAADIIDETEVLVTAGSANSKNTSGN